ncbi:DsbA family oxidoreductase [Isoptericola croceus]|uniref:DsbA family oxidoreductase n=1 Tax=Isoptericola croceus TaxID=3031406 RepID=UPI0023F967C7|nr:DsbA family oxidoreductase [Isoptericola croceus]
MIEIDVWADVRCPWCWIGLRRLERAVASVDQEVRVRRRSFLLEPDGPAHPGRTMADVAVTEWGLPTERWAAKSRLFRSEGAGEGLRINVDPALTFDSAPLHRLLKLAAEDGGISATAAWDAAFRAHFERNENLADVAVLTARGASWGLDASAAARAISGESYAAEVLMDVGTARRSSIMSVPTVVAADGRRLSGSASVEDLTSFLSAVGTVR